MMRTSILLAMIFLLAAGSAMAADDDSTAAAIAAAEEWLETIDSGAFAESWEATAAYFQAAVTRETWEQSLSAVRAPLGEMLSREISSSQYATELPGAPDGEYVVIQFTTSFANKKNAVETVTPMKDEDGSWRVSGYFIK
jgi:hypothetical protein